MSNHIPQLAALRAFQAVARQGSFVRAAGALNVSTSAVSHQIRGLELMLGARLLRRARNGALIAEAGVTEEGALLLGAVDGAFELLAEACRAVREKAHCRPMLAISANSSFTSLWLAPRLAAFAALHPSTQWQMRALESDWGPMEDGVDLAIVRVRRGRLQKGDLMLFKEKVFPIASPSLRLTGNPQELTRYSLLQEEHESSREKDWSTWLELLGAAQGARVNLVRFSTFNAAVAAAIAGRGIALGRSPLIDEELASGRLARPFGKRALAGSWDFVIRTRPGVQRDPHVALLRDYLIGSAHASAESAPGTRRRRSNPLKQ
jgi:LysR family glycine cleavage system transcriptional activator